MITSTEPVRHRWRESMSTRWAIWSWLDIPSSLNKRMTYLRRLRILQTPLFGIYLHWIFEPDADRDPHDHPWRFWSVVLRGGYAEKLYDAGVGLNGRAFVRSRWSVHTVRLSQAHQITEIEEGLVTLAVVGRRAQEWGFWTDGGWVAWRTYTGTSPSW